MIQETQRRNTGLDLLKIISMCMIIALHFYLHIISSDEDITGFNYVLACTIEAFAYQSVDIFIIITGYLSVGKEVNIKRIKNIWKRMILYSLLFLLIFCLYNRNSISISDVLYSVLPFLSGHYWFITTYIILQIIRPLIDRFRDSSTHKEYSKLLIVLIILFSAIRTFFPYSDSRFVQSGGASIVWFVTLYLCGGYISVYQIRIRKVLLIMIDLICILVPPITKFLYTFLTGSSDGSFVFYHHNSIFIFLGAVATFLLFKDIHLYNNKILKKIITFCAPSNLAVYFIHENIFAKNLVWNFVEQIKNDNIINIIILELATIVCIYITCILIDKVLTYIFVPINKIRQRN